MPLIEYEEKRFRADTLKLIEQANGILEEYEDQGFDLTLRQRCCRDLSVLRRFLDRVLTEAVAGLELCASYIEFVFSLKENRVDRGAAVLASALDIGEVHKFEGDVSLGSLRKEIGAHLLQSALRLAGHSHPGKTRVHPVRTRLVKLKRSFTEDTVDPSDRSLITHRNLDAHPIRGVPEAVPRLLRVDVLNVDAAFAVEQTGSPSEV